MFIASCDIIPRTFIWIPCEFEANPCFGFPTISEKRKQLLRNVLNIRSALTQPVGHFSFNFAVFVVVQDETVSLRSGIATSLPLISNYSDFEHRAVRLSSSSADAWIPFKFGSRDGE